MNKLVLVDSTLGVLTSKLAEIRFAHLHLDMRSSSGM